MGQSNPLIELSDFLGPALLKTINTNLKVRNLLCVLALLLFPVACEKDTAENKAAGSAWLLTSTGKRIDDIQIAYVSHEADWEPGANLIKLRLLANEESIEEIALDDIEQIQVKYIEFDADPRIGATRLEVEYVKANETIKGLSFPLGAFAVQFYIILPDDFPVSDLSQFFKPLTGSHVNPEFKLIKDEKWLRVPLVQIKSLERGHPLANLCQYSK